jgi:hypothetical protein
MDGWMDGWMDADGLTSRSKNCLQQSKRELSTGTKRRKKGKNNGLLFIIPHLQIKLNVY